MTDNKIFSLFLDEEQWIGGMAGYGARQAWFLLSNGWVDDLQRNDESFQPFPQYQAQIPPSRHLLQTSSLFQISVFSLELSVADI